LVKRRPRLKGKKNPESPRGSHWGSVRYKEERVMATTNKRWLPMVQGPRLKEMEEGTKIAWFADSVAESTNGFKHT